MSCIVTSRAEPLPDLPSNTRQSRSCLPVIAPDTARESLCRAQARACLQNCEMQSRRLSRSFGRLLLKSQSAQVRTKWQARAEGAFSTVCRRPQELDALRVRAVPRRLLACFAALVRAPRSMNSKTGGESRSLASIPPLSDTPCARASPTHNSSDQNASRAMRRRRVNPGETLEVRPSDGWRASHALTSLLSQSLPPPHAALLDLHQLQHFCHN